MKALLLRIALLIAVCGQLAGNLVLANDVNGLTDEERQAGVELLFNGRNLQGWQHEGNWEVHDGAVMCVKPGGNLICKSTALYGDFELYFEWRVLKDGSPRATRPPEDAFPDGLFYSQFRIPRSMTDLDGHQRFWGQVAYLYATGGGAVGLFSQETALQGAESEARGFSLSRAPARAASLPAGEWNKSRIIWHAKTIQHWLNGERIIDMVLALPSGIPEETRRLMERIESLSTRLRTRGLQVQIEDLESPLSYRGLKLRKGTKWSETAPIKTAKE